MRDNKVRHSIRAILAISLVVFLVSQVPQIGLAQAPGRGTPVPGRLTPVNQPEIGLIYDGLEPAYDGPCKGMFKIIGTDLCTPGPSAGPPGVDFHKSVAPVDFSLKKAPTAIQCDGDGSSGNRVQVIYAHPAGTNRYSQYLPSFQQWMADADGIFYASAQETGGSRHVRFVHDGSCLPVVLNVQLSAAGVSDFTGTITELESLGYNRTDRKYIVFMDASVYSLGIGSFMSDDRLSPFNSANYGPGYTRHDTAMWSAHNPAHELMHTLGAVNGSAPHATSTGHCWDEYDRMCYSDSSGVPMQFICTDPAHENRFDCNHDDYFNTNPAAGSYLATHWNAANNSFLIGAEPIPAPTKTWTGAADTNWLNGNNWSPSGNPASGENCLIPAGMPRYPVIVDEKDECDQTLMIAAGAQLTVDGGPVSGDEIGVVADTTVISGTVRLSNGAIFDAEIAMMVGPDGQILIEDSIETWINDGDQGGTLSVFGDVIITGTYSIGTSNATARANIFIQPSGMVELKNGGSLILNGSLTNHGMLKQTKNVPQNATTSFLNITDQTLSNKYFGVDIVLGAIGDMGLTTVTIQGDKPCAQAFATGTSVLRCYQISPANPRSSTVKFYYRAVEAYFLPVAPTAYHFNGTSWDALTSTRGGSGEAMYVQASAVNSYSPFGLNDPDFTTYWGYLPLISH